MARALSLTLSLHLIPNTIPNLRLTTHLLELRGQAGDLVVVRPAWLGLGLGLGLGSGGGLRFGLGLKLGLALTLALALALSLTLERGEDCEVDRLLVLVLGRTLGVGLGAAAEEDHAGPGSAERLVRGGGHDVGVGEGAHRLARGDEAGDVRHVHEHEGAHLVRVRARAKG